MQGDEHGLHVGMLVERMISVQVQDFAKRLSPKSEVRTSALFVLQVPSELHRRELTAIWFEKVQE